MSKFLGEAGVDVLIEEIKKRGNSGQISSLSDDLDAYIRRIWEFRSKTWPPTPQISWKYETPVIMDMIRDYVVAQLKYCGIAPIAKDGIYLPGIFDSLITTEYMSYWKPYSIDVDALIQAVHKCLDEYDGKKYFENVDTYRINIGDIGFYYACTYDNRTTDCKYPAGVKYSDLI